MELLLLCVGLVATRALVHRLPSTPPQTEQYGVVRHRYHPHGRREYWDRSAPTLEFVLPPPAPPLEGSDEWWALEFGRLASALDEERRRAGLRIRREVQSAPHGEELLAAMAAWTYEQDRYHELVEHAMTATQEMAAVPAEVGTR